MKNAEEVVGGPIEAGCIVAARGASAAKIGAAVVGQVAGSIAKAGVETAAKHRASGASPIPNDGWAQGYLALTSDELVLLSIKTGLVGQKAGAVLARAARGSVAGAELGDGKLTVPLTVRFSDGVEWSISVPRARVKDARKILAGLG